VLVPGRGARRDLDGRCDVIILMRWFAVMPVSMVVSKAVVMVAAASMSMAVSAMLVEAVPVSASAEFEDEEHGPGCDQQRANGRARLYRHSGGHELRLLAEALAQADHTVSGVPPIADTARP
jgi:hypothetical protein